MITNPFLSQYSGAELDAAIRAVNDAGLDNLLHDRGYYTSSENLPASAKRGDKALVGTDLTALHLYNYTTSWIDSGTTVDISNLNLVDNVTGEAVDKAPTQKSVKEGLNAQTFAAVISTNPFAASKAPRRIGDYALNTTTGEIWQSTSVVNAAASWNRISASFYNGSLITDWNAINLSGDLTSYGTATGAPTANESFYGHHTNSNAGTANAYQIAIGYTTGKIYQRSKVASTWGTWSIGVTATELGYLSGATSNVQTQLNTLSTDLNNSHDQIANLQSEKEDKTSKQIISDVEYDALVASEEILPDVLYYTYEA